MQHIIIYLFIEIVLSQSYQSNESNVSNCKVCGTAYISLQKCLQLAFCFAFLKQLIPVSLLHISDPLNVKTHTEAHSISCDLVYSCNKDGQKKKRENRKKIIAEI